MIKITSEQIAFYKYSRIKSYSLYNINLINFHMYPAKERIVPRRDSTSSIYSMFKPRYGANHKYVGFCFSLLSNVARPLRSNCVLAGRIPLSPYNPVLYY